MPADCHPDPIHAAAHDGHRGRLARRVILTIAALLTLSLTAAGSDIPTNDEWNPVKAAIDANDPGAQDQLLALVAHFPNWPSGHRELAKQQLNHGETGAALASAVQALKLDPSDSEAACVQVQALSAAGKPAEAYAALDAFTGKDKGGWLHYYGAKAAIDAKDLEKADRMLKDAKGKAVNSAPPEFLFMEARLDEARGDSDGAIVALGKATAAKDTFYDAWYELGRAELGQAAKFPDRAKQLLDNAENHFSRALKGRPADPNSLYGVGYARYEQAKVMLLSHDDDAAHARMREAVGMFVQAIEKQPDFAEAHYVAGNALVQLEEYQEAIVHLRRAQELGKSDRTSLFNLALALEKTGQKDAAKEILSHTEAVTPSEQITVGINAYHEHDYQLAAKLLDHVAPQVADDAERQGSVYRFLGHALRQQAELKDKAVASLADQARTAAIAERDQLLDAAAEAYAKGAAVKDYKSKDFFLASESPRSPEHAFAAGWRYLAWKSYASPSGWSVVLGNYGSWLTGGTGFKGAWARHPTHVVGWGILSGLPLILFLAAKLRRGRPSEGSRSKSSDASRQPEPERDAAPEPRRSGRSSAPAAAGRAQLPPSKRPPKNETEISVRPLGHASGGAPSHGRGVEKPAQKSGGSNETEEMAPVAVPRPAAKATKPKTGGWTRELGSMKPTNELGEDQPLERKTPRPRR